MAALPTRAVNRGLLWFAFGCAADAAYLVAADAELVPICVQAPRGALVIIIDFTRSTRARALLQAVRATLANGSRGVGSLRTYSPTRWYGEGGTISAVAAKLPALRHTLLKNQHAASPTDIPAAVSAGI